MLKKIVLGLVVLIVIIGGVGVYLFNNLDSYIRQAVEKYGTAATHATVSLDSVKLSLTSGEGSLSGLSVGNPPGFAAKQSVYLGSIAMKLDTNSVRGTGPIIIRSIVIEKPQVTYELNNGGDSNLQTIARNAQAYGQSLSGQKSANTGASGGQGRKLIIQDLDIKDGQISVSQEMLKGKQLSAPLPEIHLTNIGKDEGGASPAEVAQKILGTLTSEAGKVATGQFLNQLAPLSDIKGAVGDAISGAGTTPAGQAVDKLKGMLGQ
jgi:AsmA family